MEVQSISGNKAEVMLDKGLDISNSNALKKLLFDLLDDGISNVELDFSLTEEIDSSGLAKILFFNEQFRQRGGQVVLKNVRNQNVKDLFELIQFNRIVNIQ